MAGIWTQNWESVKKLNMLGYTDSDINPLTNILGNAISDPADTTKYSLAGCTPLGIYGEYDTGTTTIIPSHLVIRLGKGTDTTL
ncbi:MAG: hypothetical protein LIR50_11690 [Bacillota bacterium]|nr:hypothetical protein [Bacillota bacterium]